MIVVKTTHNKIGVTKIEGRMPNAIPRLATIKATSPRETMPHPIRIDCVFEYRQSKPPNPQPTTLLTTDTTQSKTIKINKLVDSCSGSNFSPMLAKNIQHKHIDWFLK